MLVSALTVGDYGQYAMAFSASGIVVGLIDNAFLVRSIRVSDRAFERERRTRSGFALVLTVLGFACFQFNYVLGFSILIAGGEIALNALKSGYLRGGRIQRVMQLDLVRQGVSIAAGGTYLLVASSPNMEFASLCYGAAYLVAVGLACFRYGVRFGGLPGRVRESTLLSFGAVAGAGYAQGDVLLLGVVAGDNAAGVYSIASMVAWAAAGLFLNHANSYVAEIRSGGSGASLKSILLPAALVAASVAGLSLVIWFLDVMNPLGPSLLVLSAFVFLRAINHVCTVMLTLAKRDVTRTSATVVTALFDIGLVFLLADIGSVGAAVAAVVSELLLLSVYAPAYKKSVKAPRVSLGVS